MASYINASGPQQPVIGADIYKLAMDAGLSVPSYINQTYADADQKHGTAFEQLCVSAGVYALDKNAFGLTSATVADVLDGKYALSASNVAGVGTTTGNSSRNLFPAAVIAQVEANLAKDRTTDGVVFDAMVAQDLSIASDVFEQPVIDYGSAGTGTQAGKGPNGAKAQRVSQLSEPTMLLSISTSDRVRRLPVWGMGIEFSDQALRATTLDLLNLSVTRAVEVEMDSRAYGWITNLWAGDTDMGTSAISSVNASTLDAASSGGALTHKAWVKWLYRSRKERKIDYVVCDIDTWLKIEGRSNRPGVNSYDPSLARIDPQAMAVNSFIGDVKVFLVDAAADGGPVPANTIYGVDSRYGIARVTNAAANYQASESFAMKRSTAMRLDWSAECFQLYAAAFDTLVLA